MLPLIEKNKIYSHTPPPTPPSEGILTRICQTVKGGDEPDQPCRADPARILPGRTPERLHRTLARQDAQGQPKKPNIKNQYQMTSQKHLTK